MGFWKGFIRGFDDRDSDIERQTDFDETFRNRDPAARENDPLEKPKPKNYKVWTFTFDQIIKWFKI